MQAVTYRKGSHKDSILGIAWNTEYKYALFLLKLRFNLYSVVLMSND